MSRTVTRPAPSRRHPFYARTVARMAERNELRGQRELREELVGGLSGRVLEVGAGSGANLRHYPADVIEVVAVEPERYLRRRLAREVARTDAAVQVVDARAERLPFDDGSFDAAVVSFVLCTVPSPGAALAELRRVLRGGGEQRYLEHVLGVKTRMSRIQRAADATLWPRLAAGCHVSRDTVPEIERAGFEIESTRRVCFRPAWSHMLMTPQAIGVARRP